MPKKFLVLREGVWLFLGGRGSANFISMGAGIFLIETPPPLVFGGWGRGQTQERKISPKSKFWGRISGGRPCGYPGGRPGAKTSVRPSKVLWGPKVGKKSEKMSSGHLSATWK